MKVKYFWMKMCIQVWHTPCEEEDMMSFMPRNWAEKDDLTQNSLYLPFYKNGVYSVSI